MRRQIAILPDSVVAENPESLRTCSKCSTWRNIRWYKNPEDRDHFICGKCYEAIRKGRPRVFTEKELQNINQFHAANYREEEFQDK